MKIEINDGTFTVDAPLKLKRQKLQVRFKDYILNYDILNYNVFPFQYGEGEYKLLLCENISGTKYKVIEQQIITAQLSSPEAPFLHPNQYVNYTNVSLPYVKPDISIPNYVSQYYAYDYIRAQTLLKKGTVLPDIQYVVNRGRGVCQDLAAFAVALFRTHGIPARLMIGYANNNYHAWCHYLQDGQWFTYDPTAEIQNLKIKKYLLSRFY